MEGKIVIITGGSSGIGEATAKYLAKAGAVVALAARRDDKLHQIKQEIIDAGGKATYHTVDVTDKAQVQKLVDDVVAEYGRLDVLINNAGLMAIAPFQKSKIDEWDKMIDINIKGVLYGIAAALPVFEKQQSGHFVNLSSVAGVKVFAPGGSVYSGTKFAVRAISEGLRQEVGGHIKTTIIFPGFVESELKSGSTDEETRKMVEQQYAENAISPDYIAKAIAYAIEQPQNVDINEIHVRPTKQQF